MADMNEEKIVEVKMLVPSDKLASFRRAAADIFPEEHPQDAASLLLSMFVTYMGDSESWTLFIPGLPNAARRMWQTIADEFAARFKAAPDERAPEALRKFINAARGGKLDAADAVAIVVEMAVNGNFTIGGAPISVKQG